MGRSDAGLRAALPDRARRDEFITSWDAAVYIQAASDPKEVRWYDTDHYFNDEARQDRMDWMARALGL